MNHQLDQPRWALTADLALVAVTLVWGATFVTVKEALADIRPFAFLAVRFAIAFLVLLPFFRREIRRGGASQVKHGLIIGVWLFVGYACQTLGLQWTTAGKAGFITGLSVVFVPLFAAVGLRQPPGRDSLLGVALATCGLALLTLGDSLRPGPGDLLVLACAVSFAMHVITIARYGRDPGASSGALATIQIGVTSLFSAVASLAFERPYWAELAAGRTASTAGRGFLVLGAAVWQAILVTALLATAGAFLIQNIAQRHTTPTHTALILSMEPVFAALFAWLLAGEALGPRGAAGGALMLAGILTAELRLLSLLGGKDGGKRRASQIRAGAGHHPS